MIWWQFFTTLNLKIFLRSLYLISIKLPYLRFWNESEKLEKELKSYLNADKSKIYSFYNWRSALFHGLQQLNFEKNSEILVSWYTCVSVINSIIQAWYKPVYVDIKKNTLNIDTTDLEKKLTKKSRWIIIQHTFWNPANILDIIKIWENYNLKIIEDCAHSLGASIGDKKVWTFWDISIFSTWRDKVISSVTWWFLLVNNNKIQIENLKQIHVNRILVIKNLLYNILWYIARKTYDIKIWKVIMYLSKKFKLIPAIITKNEKNCNFKKLNYKLPNSLAYLARKELKNIENINNHRIKIANTYKKKLPLESVDSIKFAKNIYFWYPVFSSNIDTIISKYRKKNIYLWNYWSGSNIVPWWTNKENCFYTPWTCPKAEEISKKILIFPNHYQIKNIKKILKIYNNDN